MGLKCVGPYFDKPPRYGSIEKKNKTHSDNWRRRRGLQAKLTHVHHEETSEKMLTSQDINLFDSLTYLSAL